jgi:quinol monooxygenase YgiN
MYGTIMRARVKPGQRDAFIETMSGTRSRAGDASGFQSADVAWEDKDPNRVVIIARFADKDSYVANAESPEQDAEYRRMVELLESEPEWIDVHFMDT